MTCCPWRHRHEETLHHPERRALHLLDRVYRVDDGKVVTPQDLGAHSRQSNPPAGPCYITYLWQSLVELHERDAPAQAPVPAVAKQGVERVGHLGLPLLVGLQPPLGAEDEGVGAPVLFASEDSPLQTRSALCMVTCR